MDGELLKKLKNMLKIMQPKEVFASLTDTERLELESAVSLMKLRELFEKVTNKFSKGLIS